MRAPTSAELDLILIRDEHTCMMCGTQQGEPWETDPSRTKRIKVGSRFLATAATDLDTTDLCSDCDECDEGLQEARLRKTSKQSLATSQLMAMVETTGKEEQLDVMRLLMSKFPTEARASR